MSVLTDRINSHPSLTAIPLRSTTAHEVSDLAPALSTPAVLVGAQLVAAAAAAAAAGVIVGQAAGNHLPQ
ncbi:hypothetical protein [Kitasatospora sp. DSM 101779]|uniref:hypothetical protein n=1 Tax=Kitasatospora sp. DSM 101779 TaxID=2853165 RepID=UPI0021D9EAA3|nr:hypothetical protein [Kitasatospora sp. DSM 101779]MCU7820139.1 hypothetical protein [Kitasatospora sp. DSM 101779]